MLFYFDIITGDCVKKKILVLFVLIGLRTQAILGQENVPNETQTISQENCCQPTDCISINLDDISEMPTIDIPIDEINKISDQEANNISLATKLKIAGIVLQLHLDRNKKTYLIASGTTAAIILTILAYKYYPKDKTSKS
jgi:hypothetical protein